MSKMVKKWLLSGMVVVIGLALGAVFYQKVYLPKATFATVQLDKGDFTVWVKGIGQLDAQFIYDLGFPITGRVMQINVDQGDTVEAKQLLARQDDTELQASLAEVQASHEKTLLEIRSTQREIELNQEQYDLTRLTYERYKKILKGGNVSQEQFDFAKSAMLTSKINLENAKIKLALAQSEALRVAQSIEVVNAKLHYTQLHTPVSGLVIERLVEKGQSVAAAQTVLRVLNPQSLWIKSYIDERISGALAVGQKALITLRSLPQQTFKGTVKRIDFQSDNVTQEHVVYIGFDEPLAKFYLNEQAEVSIESKILANVAMLPITTLAIYQTQQGVWLNQDSTAHFVPLKLLAIDDQAFAFEGALTAEDQVLVMQAGKKPLANGISIKP